MAAREAEKINHREEKAIGFIVASFEFGKKKDDIAKELGLGPEAVEGVISDFQGGRFGEIALKVRRRKRFYRLLKSLFAFQFLYLAAFSFAWYSSRGWGESVDLLFVLNPRLGLSALDTHFFKLEYPLGIFSFGSLVLLGVVVRAFKLDVSKRGFYQPFELFCGLPTGALLAFIGMFYVSGSKPPDFGSDIRLVGVLWVVFLLFSVVPFVLSLKVPVFPRPRMGKLGKGAFQRESHGFLGEKG